MVRDELVKFGKYAGQRVSFIAGHDLQYLIWFGSLPKVRSNPVLWPSIRAELIRHLQAEQDAHATA